MVPNYLPTYHTESVFVLTLDIFVTFKPYRTFLFLKFVRLINGNALHFCFYKTAFVLGTASKPVVRYFAFVSLSLSTSILQIVWMRL